MQSLPYRMFPECGGYNGSSGEGGEGSWSSLIHRFINFKPQF